MSLDCSSLSGLLNWSLKYLIIYYLYPKFCWFVCFLWARYCFLWNFWGVLGFFCFVLVCMYVWGALLCFIPVQNQEGKSSLPITCFSYIYLFPSLSNFSVGFATCKNFPSTSTAERRPKLLGSVQIASYKAILLMLWSLTSWHLFASENL